MRHLLYAASLLAIALAATFGTASALEIVAVAGNSGVQDGAFEAVAPAKPATGRR